jgi:hypothetical protein
MFAYILFMPTCKNKLNFKIQYSKIQKIMLLQYNNNVDQTLKITNLKKKIRNYGCLVDIIAQTEILFLMLSQTLY